MVRNFPDTRFGHSCCYDSFKPRLIIILIILAAKLYFLYRFSCFTYLHNLSNWSHDWQQISLELGKLLQKNTKLHFIFFHSLHSKKGSFNPTIPTLSQCISIITLNFLCKMRLLVIFKHCVLVVTFLIPAWSSIKLLLLLPKLLTDVYGKVCSRNIDGVAPGWTKTANFETII